MQFSDAILEYSFDCKVRRLSVKTIDNYQKQLRYLQRYLEKEYGVKEVEEAKSYQIKEFLSMMDDKQRKPRYINDLLKVFRTFFNYLKAEGHIKTKPTAQVRNMKQPKLKILTFTPNEIRSLLHFRRCCIVNDYVEVATAEYGLVESKRFDISKIDFDMVAGEGIFQKPGTRLKGIAVRSFYVEIVASIGGALYYLPRDPNTATRHVRQFMRSIGLPGISPHDLRHTCATLLLENGADIKSVLKV